MSLRYLGLFVVLAAAFSGCDPGTGPETESKYPLFPTDTLVLADSVTSVLFMEDIDCILAASGSRIYFLDEQTHGPISFIEFDYSRVRICETLSTGWIAASADGGGLLVKIDPQTMLCVDSISSSDSELGTPVYDDETGLIFVPNCKGVVMTVDLQTWSAIDTTELMQGFAYGPPEIFSENLGSMMIYDRYDYFPTYRISIPDLSLRGSYVPGSAVHGISESNGSVYLGLGQEGLVEYNGHSMSLVGQITDQTTWAVRVLETSGSIMAGTSPGIAVIDPETGEKLETWWGNSSACLISVSADDEQAAAVLRNEPDVIIFFSRE
jgi:hypothetical protein